MNDQQPAGTLSDERMDQILGNILRGGVILATSVVLIGGIYYLSHYGNDRVDLSEFQRDRVRPTLRTIPGIIEEALALRRKGLIQFGVLLLIATPVARVVFSVIAFALQRDWTYVVVTLIVLAVLLFGIFVG